jgi:hypothetical protein
MPPFQFTYVEDADLPPLQSYLTQPGEGASPQSVWSPAMIGGQVLWLRADIGTVIATGVSQWNDQSGQGNNVSQVTGSKQPTRNIIDPVYNNQSTLSFASASSQYLVSGTWGSSPSVTTIIIVGEMDGNTQYFIDGITSSNRNAIFFDASKNFSSYQGTTTLAFGAPTPGSPHVWATQFTGTAANAMFQDNSQTPVITGNSGTNLLTGTIIGSYYGPGDYLQGKIAEVIIYNSVLSPSQMSTVFHYLGARYGITVS